MMMHRCPDGRHNRLERSGPVGTLEGVRFRCARCGWEQSAAELEARFEAARERIVAALSSGAR